MIIVIQHLDFTDNEQPPPSSNGSQQTKSPNHDPNEQTQISNGPQKANFPIRDRIEPTPSSKGAQQVHSQIRQKKTLTELDRDTNS